MLSAHPPFRSARSASDATCSAIRGASLNLGGQRRHFLPGFWSLRFRSTWPLVTMGLLVSDFRGVLSFKYPILLPHQLLVWETWSASAREPVLYAEEGEEAGCRARPLMAELWAPLWLVSTSCVQLLSTQLSTRLPVRQRPTDSSRGGGGACPRTQSPELGLPSAPLTPLWAGRPPARLSLPEPEHR